MTKIPDNIKSLSASEIGRKLSKQELCPIDLVSFYLDQIQNFNGLSPFIKVFNKEAIQNAILSRDRIKNGKALSLFDGVPIAWKDLFDISGYQTLGGSNLLKNSEKVKKDAQAVLKAKNKGLIPIGKTLTVEFALGGLGTNKYFGTPSNAIMKDVPRVPGGSSSGSATALAHGMCAAAIGTDTGGSVRIPAVWNKLFGFKTSFGHISTQGVLPLAKSLDTVGPLTKSVEDAKMLYSILSGNVEKNFKNFSALNSNILIARGTPFNNLDPVIEEFCELALSLLSNSGIKIKDEKIPEIEEMYEVLSEYGTLVTAEAWQQWKHLIESNEKLIDSNVLNRMHRGKEMDIQSVNIIKSKQKKLSKKLYKRLDLYDAMLMPTVPILPPKIYDVESSEESYDKYNMLALRNTSIGNILPMCAITIPSNNHYLPLGLMLYKPIGEDFSLLRTAEEYSKIINI